MPLLIEILSQNLFADNSALNSVEFDIGFHCGLDNIPSVAEIGRTLEQTGSRFMDPYPRVRHRDEGIRTSRFGYEISNQSRQIICNCGRQRESHGIYALLESLRDDLGEVISKSDVANPLGKEQNGGVHFGGIMTGTVCHLR